MDSIMYFVGFLILILIILWIVSIINKNSSHHRTKYFHSVSKNKNTLPNGYSRQDYYAYGYSDFDIEYMGLDQPGAPSPQASGVVIADMLDGDIEF
ncbi:MAG: hypothetical protein ACTSQ8_15530 [Candidatus Helarchaeota archaeon]